MNNQLHYEKNCECEEEYESLECDCEKVLINGWRMTNTYSDGRVTEARFDQGFKVESRTYVPRKFSGDELRSLMTSLGNINSDNIRVTI